MIDSEQYYQLKDEIEIASKEDMQRLSYLREELRILDTPRQIRDYTTTAVSLVASDGGNNRLRFDPFDIQIIRVVDSYGAQACLKVVSRYKNVKQLSEEQFDQNNNPVSPLGELMKDLGVYSLSELSPMLNPKIDEHNREVLNSSWVLVYRDLWEWAVLYEKIKKGFFSTDTLIVIDGLLRSKIFSGTLFIDMIKCIQGYIQDIKNKQRRNVYLVGVAKTSKVLERYRLALMLENLMREARPVYVPVPKEIEELAYVWPEYTRRPEDEIDGGEKAKFVGGRLYLVKFGPKPGDPIWPVDILIGQECNVDKIIGYLKSDAEMGFPIPFYPKCIQKAHEYAAITGIDMEIVQHQIVNSLIGLLPERDIRSFEEFMLIPKDPGGARYE